MSSALADLKRERRDVQEAFDRYANDLRSDGGGLEAAH